jgi:hypothetical protein
VGAEPKARFTGGFFVEKGIVYIGKLRRLLIVRGNP